MVQIRKHDDDGRDVVRALLVLQPAAVGSRHKGHGGALNILVLGHLHSVALESHEATSTGAERGCGLSARLKQC